MNPLQLIDTYIRAPFAKVLYRGAPIKLYPFIAIGTEGVTVPHVAITLHKTKEQTRDARPDHELFCPSAEQTTIEVQRELGGGSETGPISYDRHNFPSPYTLLYEIQLVTREADDMSHITWELMQAFPPKHTPRIEDLLPVFDLDDGINVNENDPNLFIWSFIMNVYDVWVTRRQVETYQSMRSAMFEMGTTT